MDNNNPLISGPIISSSSSDNPAPEPQTPQFSTPTPEIPQFERPVEPIAPPQTFEQPAQPVVPQEPQQYNSFEQPQVQDFAEPQIPEEQPVYSNPSEQPLVPTQNFSGQQVAEDDSFTQPVNPPQDFAPQQPAQAPQNPFRSTAPMTTSGRFQQNQSQSQPAQPTFITPQPQPQTPISAPPLASPKSPMNRTKKLIILAVSIIALIAAAFGAYSLFLARDYQATYNASQSFYNNWQTFERVWSLRFPSDSEDGVSNIRRLQYDSISDINDRFKTLQKEYTAISETTGLRNSDLKTIFEDVSTYKSDIFNKLDSDIAYILNYKRLDGEIRDFIYSDQFFRDRTEALAKVSNMIGQMNGASSTMGGLYNSFIDNIVKIIDDTACWNIENNNSCDQAVLYSSITDLGIISDKPEVIAELLKVEKDLYEPFGNENFNNRLTDLILLSKEKANL
jgi:hypothetical protein